MQKAWCSIGLAGLLAASLLSIPAVAQPPEIEPEAIEPDAIDPVETEVPADSETPLEPEDLPLTPEEQALLDAIHAAGPIEEHSLRPCRFGVYGPPLNVRDPDVGESGIEIYDPCGLRFTNLSGIWDMHGDHQVIAYHIRRGGEFAMRFTHVDAEHAYYQTWGYMFGDDWYLGRIAPDTIDLTAIARYPVRMRETCPDEWEAGFPVHAIYLGYNESGQVYMRGARIRNNLSGSCEVTYLDTVWDIMVRQETGARPWTD